MMHAAAGILCRLFKHDHVTPAQIIILGFLLLIFTGAVLLMPFFHPGARRGLIWGCAVHRHFRHLCDRTGAPRYGALLVTLGQLVILLLIQVGGMGVVTIAVAIFMFAGKRIGLKQRWVMQESISAPQVGGIVRMTGFILKTASFLIEGLGPCFGPAVLPAIWSWKRTLVRGVSLSVRVLQMRALILWGVNSRFFPSQTT